MYDVDTLRTSEIILYPPGNEPLGLYYSDLCNKWCQWIVSVPIPTNPTLELHSVMGQQSHNIPHMVFLCQSFDFQYVPSPPKRSMVVPADSIFFMPIINWLFGLEAERKDELAELKSQAKEKMDEAANLRLSVNEKPVEIELTNFRFQTFLSDIILPNDNVLGIEPGGTFVVADGFWVLFRPLVNRFRVETFGSCQSGATRIAVRYDLVAATET
jgi:hypothetical protein